MEFTVLVYGLSQAPIYSLINSFISPSNNNQIHYDYKYQPIWLFFMDS